MIYVKWTWLATWSHRTSLNHVWKVESLGINLWVTIQMVTNNLVLVFMMNYSDQWNLKHSTGNVMVQKQFSWAIYTLYIYIISFSFLYHSISTYLSIYLYIYRLCIDWPCCLQCPQFGQVLNYWSMRVFPDNLRTLQSHQASFCPEEHIFWVTELVDITLL